MSRKEPSKGIREAAFPPVSAAGPEPYPLGFPEQPSIRLRIPPLTTLSIPVASEVGVIIARSIDHHGAAFSVPLALWLALFSLPSMALSRRPGITLTPQMAVIRNVRTQRIVWSDVLAVTVAKRWGTRRVFLWTLAGKRVNLRAPITPFPGVGNRKFDERVDTIRQWWLAHRGSAVSDREQNIGQAW